MSSEAPTQAPPRRRELALWLVGLLVLAVVLVGTVVAMGGRIEAATWGLVVAASAMVFALHSLYRMATVLSRPAVEVVLEQDDVAALAGVRELREEKRRVLRSINELQFDYEMGKLSDEDFQKVRQGYQLRAVEVMRALEERPSLHPRLADALAQRGMTPSTPASEDAKDHSEDEDEVEAKAEVSEDEVESKAEAKAEVSEDEVESKAETSEDEVESKADASDDEESTSEAEDDEASDEPAEEEAKG